MLASFLTVGEEASAARVFLDTEGSPQMTPSRTVWISAQPLQLASHLEKWKLALPWKKTFFF